MKKLFIFICMLITTTSLFSQEIFFDEVKSGMTKTECFDYCNNKYINIPEIGEDVFKLKINNIEFKMFPNFIMNKGEFKLCSIILSSKKYKTYDEYNKDITAILNYYESKYGFPNNLNISEEWITPWTINDLEIKVQMTIEEDGSLRFCVHYIDTSYYKSEYLH